MTQSAVELRGVEFAYGERGFRLRVDALQIAPGERVACIGPSGTGKTTLVNLLAGVAVPDRGTVRAAGAALTELSDDRRRALRLARIGLVFQGFELLDYLTAAENVLLPYHLARSMVLDGAVRGRAAALAAAVGIERVWLRRPSELSQGERQRVALCRALVTRPELLLCDEPLGNLDPETAGEALELILEQARELGATVFLVTHDHSILDRFDRVIDVRELGSAS